MATEPLFVWGTTRLRQTPGTMSRTYASVADEGTAGKTLQTALLGPVS